MFLLKPCESVPVLRASQDFMLQLESFPGPSIRAVRHTVACERTRRSGEATMSRYVMDGVREGFKSPPLPEK